MRIISGKFRGRRIDTIKNKELRPTMGVAREAMFNILSHGQFADLLPGAKVLDLFCGCGAFSMEALSRGAEHVVCIDINSDHLAVARYNIDKVGALSQATFIRRDSTNPPAATMQCNVVFIDPPYHSELAIPALKKSIDRGWISDDAVIILETGLREDIALPPHFEVCDDRTYSKSRIRIIQRLSHE